jgi:hypothetical protein
MATVTVTSADVLAEWLRLGAEAFPVGPRSTGSSGCGAAATMRRPVSA